MILYVVTETYKEYRKRRQWSRHRKIFEAAAKDACLVLHYRQISPAVISRIRPWAICHSGTSTDYEEYDVMKNKAYRETVRNCTVPQLGICGGLQLLAVFFGAKVAPMRRLKPNEPESQGKPGYFNEIGFYPVRIKKADPLFKGLPKVIWVYEHHYREIKTPGPEIKLLASTTTCRFQAFRHVRKPIWGVQFHPEETDRNHGDGTKILKNFFSLVKNTRREHEQSGNLQ